MLSVINNYVTLILIGNRHPLLHRQLFCIVTEKTLHSPKIRKVLSAHTTTLREPGPKLRAFVQLQKVLIEERIWSRLTHLEICLQDLCVPSPQRGDRSLNLRAVKVSRQNCSTENKVRFEVSLKGTGAHTGRVCSVSLSPFRRRTQCSNTHRKLCGLYPICAWLRRMNPQGSRRKDSS